MIEFGDFFYKEQAAVFKATSTEKNEIQSWDERAETERCSGF